MSLQLELIKDLKGLNLVERVDLSGPARHAVFKELCTKLGWALGSAYGLPYGHSTPLGELARRFALIAMTNYSTD